MAKADNLGVGLGDVSSIPGSRNPKILSQKLTKSKKWTISCTSYKFFFYIILVYLTFKGKRSNIIQGVSN